MRRYCILPALVKRLPSGILVVDNSEMYLYGVLYCGQVTEKLAICSVESRYDRSLINMRAYGTQKYRTRQVYVLNGEFIFVLRGAREALSQVLLAILNYFIE